MCLLAEFKRVPHEYGWNTCGHFTICRHLTRIIHSGKAPALYKPSMASHFLENTDGRKESQWVFSSIWSSYSGTLVSWKCLNIHITHCKYSGMSVSSCLQVIHLVSQQCHNLISTPPLRYVQDGDARSRTAGIRQFLSPLPRTRVFCHSGRGANLRDAAPLFWGETWFSPGPLPNTANKPFHSV